MALITTRKVGVYSILLFCVLLQQKTDAFQPYTRYGSVYTKHSGLIQQRRASVIRPSMNIFSRFIRLTKAQLNHFLWKIEDPEKVMNQAVMDLNDDLARIRHSYAEVLATQRRMEKERATTEEAAVEWLSRARLAVKKGDDELAKEALTRKQQAIAKIETLTGQLAIQSDSLKKLFESMSILESKMQEAKSMKDQYIARAKTAITATKVNDMLNGIGSSAMSSFDRMKEKVEVLEVQAEVSNNLLGAVEQGTTEAKFKQLEGGHNIEEELARLKSTPRRLIED